MIVIDMEEPPARTRREKIVSRVLATKLTDRREEPGGFWTRPRRLLDQWLALIVGAAMMLWQNPRYAAILLALIATGGLIALAFRLTRQEKRLSIR